VLQQPSLDDGDLFTSNDNIRDPFEYPHSDTLQNNLADAAIDSKETIKLQKNFTEKPTEMFEQQKTSKVAPNKQCILSNFEHRSEKKKHPATISSNNLTSRLYN
jgi:hypothetical protein